MMTNEDYKQLEITITESLSAHQRAKFNLSSARETIAKLIVKRFKKYLDTQAPNPYGDDDYATPK